MKSPQQYNRIFFMLLAAGILLLLIGMTSESLPLQGLGLLTAFGSFVFRAITYRCPHCRHYLGRRSGTACPHCKKKIN